MVVSRNYSDLDEVEQRVSIGCIHPPTASASALTVNLSPSCCCSLALWCRVRGAAWIFHILIC